MIEFIKIDVPTRDHAGDLAGTGTASQGGGNRCGTRTLRDAGGSCALLAALQRLRLSHFIRLPTSHFPLPTYTYNFPLTTH